MTEKVISDFDHLLQNRREENVQNLKVVIL